MLGKLKGIEERFAEVERQLGDPSVFGNSREYARLAKERAQLQEVVDRIRDYRRALDEVAGHKAVLEGHDAELRELASLLGSPGMQPVRRRSRLAPIRAASGSLFSS